MFDASQTVRLEVGRKHKKNWRIREPEQGKRWVSRPFPARHSLPAWDGVPLEPDDALGQRNFAFPETLPRVAYLVLVPAVAVLKTREGSFVRFAYLAGASFGLAGGNGVLSLTLTWRRL